MRILALGGVGGPVLFAAVVLVCAALRPDYSHSMQVMSALGETGGPNALLMNAAGFVPTGLLLMGFAISLSRLVPRTALATAGALFLGLFSRIRSTSRPSDLIALSPASPSSYRRSLIGAAAAPC